MLNARNINIFNKSLQFQRVSDYIV